MTDVDGEPQSEARKNPRSKSIQGSSQEQNERVIEDGEDEMATEETVTQNRNEQTQSGTV